MFESFKTRMNQEGKKVKTGGGFGGTGFKVQHRKDKSDYLFNINRNSCPAQFDATEDTYTSEKKKFQKAALGLQDSDDDDVEQEIDAQIESLLSAKRTIRAIDSSSMMAPGSVGGAVGGGPADLVAVPKDKLQLAKQLAAKLQVCRHIFCVTICLI